MCLHHRPQQHFAPIILITLMTFCVSAEASEKVPEFITFTFENDLFAGDDAGYTNGVGVTYGKGPFETFDTDTLPDWLHWLTKDLYISTMKNKRRSVAHMFFQQIQTPADLSKTELVVDDVPYAGLLAWQGTLYAWDDHISDQFSLLIGVVGSISLAEQTQTFVHDLIGSDEPMGWDNQIGNELVFKIEAQRIWSLYRSNGKGTQFDILGQLGAGIGNFESAAKGGFAIRWGTNLASNFQSFSLQLDRQVNPISSTSGRDFYVFLGARVGVVLNNIFIDGNTFKDSHSVPLEHFQDQVSTGLVWSYGRNAFVFQASSISSSTTISDDREDFGAISYTRGF